MIKEIMHSDIVKLKTEDDLKKALETINANKVNGAPVVDENDKLVGIIVKADIYRFLMEEGHYDTCPVDWVMTKNVVTASEDEDIVEVAARLRENDIIAIPIVDGGVLKGIVTIEDIVDYIIEKEQYYS
ncbi:CBS domain containing protein [Clostridium carboxidivorans P7]|uniref:Putative signal transduction protein with CBS domains n=1 Tax=Clostridium carboxidivorans P7 TaxID=536227 RepID=C6PXN3_9CLOT|nr:CBS domain-containing protein [Clostridium carboxidivorans]AKN30943.1 CBS domain containing protein [Clostridium carboxidivorans P7]EET86011.1 putative signal transduction protein with CBS domains [Clostridium carboxidivorans P7]EFG88800.1 CBS domain pair [Clostridium carboxidivorans P7]